MGGQIYFPVDMKALVKRKNDTVTQLQQGISYLLEKNGVSYLNGWGELGSGRTIRVNEKNYNSTVIAKDIILATGSSTCHLPISGMDLPDVLTSPDALNLDTLPSDWHRSERVSKE